MKKVALLFIVAVIAPSLALAWLAVRSLRDQQFVLERQQSLLYQGVADSVAKEVQDVFAEELRSFVLEVDGLLLRQNANDVAKSFDDRLRTNWPLAEVGFVVTQQGDLLCPLPGGRREAGEFVSANGKFLGNREAVQVYWNVGKQALNLPAQSPGQQQKFANPLENQYNSTGSQAAGQAALPSRGQQQRIVMPQPPQQQAFVPNQSAAPQEDNRPNPSASQPASSVNQQPAQRANSPLDNAVSSSLNAGQQMLGNRNPQVRNVMPQQSGGFQNDQTIEDSQYRSKISAAEAEFRQLIGEASDGTLARFLDNKLVVLFWYRPPQAPGLIFGSQIALARLKQDLHGAMDDLSEAVRDEVCAALLDDNARPVALSRPGFNANWKRPFVAAEIGEALPHWEVAVYLLNPAKLSQTAHALRMTLGLLIALLILAIGSGSFLIVRDLNRQLRLARQKTDFVSNVSHELKTPLTSIRMFSELLAEGRVTDSAKQRSYLNIITAETARLTRLINNVLDFSRLERGEKKYNFQRCDLAEVVRETADTLRPHLEQSGFRFDCELPEPPQWVRGDRDALAQVLVNLISNAEKYSDRAKEISIRAQRREHPLPHFELQVLDRGLGVPRGCEEKIFEQFYRAHDSLSSGIQGSGLGLTLARQIARAHGGDVAYEPREGGGSCFSLRLPCGAEAK